MKQKAVEEAFGGWHGRVASGTGRAKLLTWGNYIFVFNLCISAQISSESSFFCSKTQSLEYLFLKLNNLQLK